MQLHQTESVAREEDDPDSFSHHVVFGCLYFMVVLSFFLDNHLTSYDDSRIGACQSGCFLLQKTLVAL